MLLGCQYYELSCSSTELLRCNSRVVKICPSECIFALRLFPFLLVEIWSHDAYSIMSLCNCEYELCVLKCFAWHLNSFFFSSISLFRHPFWNHISFDLEYDNLLSYIFDSIHSNSFAMSFYFWAFVLHLRWLPWPDPTWGGFPVKGEFSMSGVVWLEISVSEDGIEKIMFNFIWVLFCFQCHCNSLLQSIFGLPSLLSPWLRLVFAATISEKTFSNAALFAALQMASAYPTWRIVWLIASLM